MNTEENKEENDTIQITRKKSFILQNVPPKQPIHSFIDRVSKFSSKICDNMKCKKVQIKPSQNQIQKHDIRDEDFIPTHRSKLKLFYNINSNLHETQENTTLPPIKNNIEPDAGGRRTDAADIKNNTKKELSITTEINSFPFQLWEHNKIQKNNFKYNIKTIPKRKDICININTDEFHEIELLTSGSNSNIFNANWNTQPIIVKMLMYDEIFNHLAINEFENEIDVLLRIKHENIVNLYGYGMAPRPFLVLEKLKDISMMLHLYDPIPSTKIENIFTFRELLHIAFDIANAMDYLHDKMRDDMMIIHRDIKPENIAVDSNGILKLIDFGLCRYVKKHENIDETYIMSTNTGTIRYMAPEVVIGKPYNEKVDVFSFSITIWAIGCNKLPYQKMDKPTYTNEIILNGKRPKFLESWPPEFCELLASCWSQDFTIRPSFQTIKEKLEGFIEQ